MPLILVLLFSPLLALFGAFIYAAMLFWPVMLLLGAVNDFLPWVPALRWHESYMVLMLLGLLIPTGANVSSK